MDGQLHKERKSIKIHKKTIIKINLLDHYSSLIIF